MSQTRIRTIILAVTTVLVIITPTVVFVLSQRFHSSSSAGSSKKYTAPVTATTSSTDDLSAAQTDLTATNGDQSADTSASPSPSFIPEVSFGPTLNFNLKIEARPTSDQSTNLFIGLAQGGETSTPTYLISFTIDVPKSGEYKGLSLAGLTVGSTYTAYLKGKQQISTASAFLMQPGESNLNQNQPVFLTTGDLNEDNVINQSDYEIEKAHIGLTSTSANWYPEGDFNKDGVVNLMDLAVILRNMAKVGTSGVWQSTPASTGSVSLSQPVSLGSPLNVSPSVNDVGGYWLWVPPLK